MINNQQAPNVNGFTIRYNGRFLQLLTEVIIQAGGRQVKVRALWDTGATGTCIDKKLAEQLELVSIGNQISHTAAGEGHFNVYCIDLKLPNNVTITDVPVAGADLRDFEVLVGMDIITKGDFSVSCFKGVTQFSFRIPSLGDADFRNNGSNGFKGIPVVKGKKIMPNEPCPCGSGKKYKQCCGK